MLTFYTYTFRVTNLAGENKILSGEKNLESLPPS